MRRIYTRLSYFTLTFLLICICSGCKTDDEGNIIPEFDTITFDQFMEIDFTATIEGPDGPVSFESDDPVNVKEGADVTFTSNSLVIKEYSDGKREENTYAGDLNWEFSADGNDPITLTGNSIAKTFNNVGAYDLKIKFGGTAEIDPTEATFVGFVTVEKPFICLPIEVTDMTDENELSTTYTVDQENARITESLLFLDGIFGEKHVHNFDADGSFTSTDFYDETGPTPRLLGAWTLERNENGQLTSAITTDDQNNRLNAWFFTTYNGQGADEIPSGGYTEVLNPNSGEMDRTDFTFTGNPEGTDVARMDLSRDNVPLGHIEWEFKVGPKVTSGARYIEREFPQFFNGSDIEKELIFDFGGSLFSDKTYFWGDPSEENCDKSGNVEIDENGTVTTRRAIGYVRFQF